MRKLIIILLLCSISSAQERPHRSSSPALPLLSTDTPEQSKDRDIFLKKWNVDLSGSGVRLQSGGGLWITEPAPPVWMIIRNDEVEVGWLFPVCTIENLKRAPKLTAWVVAKSGFTSPQAKWLTALFNNCGIKSAF